MSPAVRATASPAGSWPPLARPTPVRADGHHRVRRDTPDRDGAGGRRSRAGRAPGAESPSVAPTATVRSATRSACPLRTMPPSSGAAPSAANGLVVGTADEGQVLVGVPGCEQRDGEDRRTPQAHPAVTFDARRADRHEHGTRHERDVGHAAVHAHPKASLAHHVGDLGDDDRRRTGEGQCEQDLRPCRGFPEQVGHAVVHEHRGHALEQPLSEERGALRSSWAPNARGARRPRRYRARPRRRRPIPAERGPP